MTSPRSRMRRYVLDANALISFVENRPVAADRVRRLLGEASLNDDPLLMSAVNWGEVFYIAWKLHGESGAMEVEANLLEMPIAIIAADQPRASRAGALKQQHGLGYADAFAAELAIEQRAWLVTADEEFLKMGKVISVYQLPRYGK